MSLFFVVSALKFLYLSLCGEILIAQVERSALIVATSIHGLPAEQLIVPEQHERFFTYSPMLISERAASDAMDLDIEPAASK